MIDSRLHSSEPVGRQDAPPFHTSAAIEWRWGALATARTATTEEDMLTELLGREDAHDVETERAWLRVDIDATGLGSLAERASSAR